MTIPTSTPSQRRPSTRLDGWFRLCVWGLLLATQLIYLPTADAQAGSETARFQLADTYLRAGQFDRAIGLLEDLYAANPEYAFFSKLKQAYESTKKYDEALTLIDGRLSIDSNKAVLLAEKARILYLGEQTQDAYDTWDAAVQLAPDDAATYRLVYQSLSQVREFDRAIELLESARGQLADSTLFRRDLGNLYSLTSQYAKSMEEYVGLLQEDPRHLSTIKSTLSRYADEPTVAKQSIEVVERQVRSYPLNVELRELLGWLYVESGDFGPALDTYRAIDRLQNHQGRTLFAFAGQALASGGYQIALDAYNEILTRYPNNAIAPEALRGTADVEAAWARELGERVGPDDDQSAAPHFSSAQEIYHTFLGKYPVSQNVPYVLLDVGRLHQNVFREFDKARELYRSILSRYSSHPAADEAVFEMGRLDVITERLEDARLEFSRIADRLHTGDLAEQARYEVALIHFYRGEFAAAEALVSALKENTSDNTANDAIGLKVLLTDNQSADSINAPLMFYSAALLRLRQFRLDDALAELDSLSRLHPGSDLEDDAAFLRASILEQLHKFDDAYTTFAQIALQFPTSFLADRGLFAAAEIQEKQLGDAEKAIELYTRLLEEYPGSLLAARARERIRTLRGDNV